MLHQPRINFYRRTIEKWIPDRDATVLVVGGVKTTVTYFSHLGSAT